MCWTPRRRAFVPTSNGERDILETKRLGDTMIRHFLFTSRSSSRVARRPAPVTTRVSVLKTSRLTRWRGRTRRRVSAKKASFTGAPVVGKSSFAVRKTVAPKAGRVVAMASNAEPIMEAPFKGIMDDLAKRKPLYIDDFKQGISTKSLVRVPIFPLIRLPPF